MRPSSPDRSIGQSIRTLLTEKGQSGATLTEIYEAARAAFGEKARKSSIRAELYRRLRSSKSAYKPMFERIMVAGETRYRLLKR